MNGNGRLVAEGACDPDEGESDADRAKEAARRRAREETRLAEIDKGAESPLVKFGRIWS